MLFLVDENLPEDISDILGRLGHDTLYVPETDLRGATDQELWRFAAQERRVIVTRDLDFPLAESPRPLGVVLVRVPDWFTRGQIAEVMSSYASEGSLEETADSITIVSPGRIRVRKL